MLFLLVVLATGWGWRATAQVLTVFTAGHAISLAAVALGGFGAPARIVEPAIIAATIVGMALVFGCALIHGLGLAGALSGLGLDSSNRLLSLLGFNAGIEAAQVGVALVAGLLIGGVRRLQGPAWLAPATRMASRAGSMWLLQRAI